jgi:flagellar motor switch protein FliG
MTATTLESRLRQIAILVASVDTTAARQLLMHLPTEIAKRVRTMAADIGPVPPEERRALLAEFQRAQTPLKSNANPGPPGSESNSANQQLTAKAFADFALQSSSTTNTIPESNSPSWTRLGVDALVRLVRLERPTIIAVVLQQLPATQVAAVLQRLPQTTTKEALRALGSLQDIDDEAMRAIDEHLSERLRDYHHKIESELEQTRRMNELLAAAPPEMKQQWASWLRPDVYLDEDESMGSRPLSAISSAMNTLDNLYKSATVTTSDSQWMDANKLASSPTNSPVAATIPPQSSEVSPPVPLATSTHNPSPVTTKVADSASVVKPEVEAEGPHTIPFPGVRTRTDSSPAQPVDRSLLRKNMDRVLSLSPDNLAQLLSSLDSETILLALAGASTQFMKRFRGMLEPEDAKVLDERIQRIGPVLLRQIDEAQQRLVDAYLTYVNPNLSRRAA